jgi:hypothetical protein
MFKFITVELHIIPTGYRTRANVTYAKRGLIHQLVKQWIKLYEANAKVMNNLDDVHLLQMTAENPFAYCGVWHE